MSVVSESSPDLSRKPIVRGRRVPISTAISVVLLSGAVGFVLGIVYPPEMLMSHFRFPPGLEASGAAPAVVKTPERAATTRAPAPATISPGPDKAPPSDRRRDAAASAVPEALPQQATAPAPAPAADKGARDTARVGDPATSAEEERERAPGAESENAKSAGKSSETPKRARRERAARAKRRQKADPTATNATPKEIVSQIPIVGPAMGFVLP
jgi:hypothetical protein